MEFVQSDSTLIAQAAVQREGICVILPFWLDQMDKTGIVT